MKRFALSLAVYLCAVGNAYAVAQLPPIEEIAAASDVIVEAEVTAVKCDSKTIVSSSGTRTSYRATLTVDSVAQGASDDTAYVTFVRRTSRPDPNEPDGGCTGPLIPEPRLTVGRAGTFYLLEREDGMYTALHAEASGGGSLPACEREDDPDDPPAELLDPSEENTGCDATNQGSPSLPTALFGAVLLLGFARRRTRR